MSTNLRDLRSLLSSLALLAALVLASSLLAVLGSWLSARGGLPLLLAGLTAIWSTLLLAGALTLAHRKRQRDRAVDAALARLRAALEAPPDEERQG